ncbi:sulfotransferase family protein [Roseovarius aestuariivivens]|uniref:sulfotransferase family protein n=1 Tax=Roseovarius aestuariivivens TaxID=1888910 RepID=UPI001436725F|nr:sulfotransferase [Roseovarius aestuariivivens]
MDRFVFICGLHRSGTTLLERILAAKYDVSYLRASVPESEGQHMQSVYSAAMHFGGPGRFAFSTEMRAELDALLSDPEGCRARIIADWSRFVVGNSKTLLEKSPPNLTKINWLRQIFPDCRIVIVTRDPRAVSAATHKWADLSLAELMRHWDAAYTQAMSDYKAEDCVLVRYEDLCRCPEDEISRVADFLQLTTRNDPEQIEERHKALVNSNEKYFVMHGEANYGPGIWNRLGYDI